MGDTGHTQYLTGSSNRGCLRGFICTCRGLWTTGAMWLPCEGSYLVDPGAQRSFGPSPMTEGLTRQRPGQPALASSWSCLEQEVGLAISQVPSNTNYFRGLWWRWYTKDWKDILSDYISVPFNWKIRGSRLPFFIFFKDWSNWILFQNLAKTLECVCLHLVLNGLLREDVTSENLLQSLDFTAFCLFLHCCNFVEHFLSFGIWFFTNSLYLSLIND